MRANLFLRHSLHRDETFPLKAAEVVVALNAKGRVQHVNLAAWILGYLACPV